MSHQDKSELDFKRKITSNKLKNLPLKTAKIRENLNLRVKMALNDIKSSKSQV